MSFLREAERWYSAGNAQVASSPIGESIAIGTIGGVFILDTETGDVRRTPELAVGAVEPLSLRFSPDGSLLAGIVRLANDESQLRTQLYLWQVSDASHVRTMQPPLERWPFMGVEFTSDGRNVIAATATGTYIYSISSSRVLRTLQAANDLCSQPGTSNVMTVAGVRLNLLSTQDPSLIQSILHPEDGKVFSSCTFSPDGRFLAVTDRGGFNEGEDTTVNLQMWDFSANRLIYSLEILRSQRKGVVFPSSISFSPDGELLLVSVWDYFDGPVPIRIVKSSDGTDIATLQPADYAVFGADGKGILTSSQGIISLIALAPERAAASETVLATPAPEKTLASEALDFEGGDLIALLDPPSFRSGHEITHHEGYLSVANHHDNSWIAAPTLFPSVRLRNQFTLSIDISGRKLALWGRLGYHANPEKYPEWWQGISVLHIQSSEDGHVHLEFFDGLSGEALWITLPDPVRAGITFSLRFLDPQGKSVKVFDEDGESVATYHIFDFRQVSLPDGLFPEGAMTVGTWVGPGQQLVVEQLTLEFDKESE